MAALERMSSTAALRCAQCLLNKLVARFGTTDTFALREDAAALLSGLVSFGAELNGDHATGSSRTSGGKPLHRPDRQCTMVKATR